MNAQLTDIGDKLKNITVYLALIWLAQCSMCSIELYNAMPNTVVSLPGEGAE